MVEYTYNAWGRLDSIGGPIANTVGLVNPLRYRGYCYDDKTGLYYLNSRYYNPTWCRFISEDIAQIQAAAGNTVSGNLYAYCDNNPVNNSDPDGNICISADTIANIINLIALLIGVGVAIKAAIRKLAGNAAKNVIKKSMIWMTKEAIRRRIFTKKIAQIIMSTVLKVVGLFLCLSIGQVVVWIMTKCVKHKIVRERSWLFGTWSEKIYFIF